MNLNGAFMKNIVLSALVILFFAVNGCFAQDKQPLKVNEIGVTFANFDNFGIRYKTGSEKTLLRITLLAMNLNLNKTWGEDKDSTTHKSNGYGAGIRIGFEKPIHVAKNFNLYYGLDFVGNIDVQTSTDEYPYTHSEGKSWSVSPGVAFVFGGSYDVGEHLRFSAEISPTLSYTYQHNTSSINEEPEVITQSGHISFGLSNYGASITVAYRFMK
jgi:hypothetical protein